MEIMKAVTASSAGLNTNMKTFIHFLDYIQTSANQKPESVAPTGIPSGIAHGPSEQLSTLPPPIAVLEKSLRKKGAEHLTEEKKRVAATSFDKTPTKPTEI
jgi:hypothetical protein